VARVQVRDEGAGMNQKTVARLFEPFFTTKKRGTGLGLSIVRQIIDLHGGTIDVQSEAGRGTTFTIELPTNNFT
jgi:signal transduction histidine kinase